ncbi:DUF397 domain-containing protein [Amycolatopsis kentuckyensis]|uniref:DUF397 domain-containing protein n=1 Tax=Amycolatopsis kentuckyensis TaxID=218823 RepID=UPI003564EA43
MSQTSKPKDSLRFEWKKSSFSMAHGSCVETLLTPVKALVRDTKDRRPGQPTLEYSAPAWSALIRLVSTEDH